MFCVQPIGYPLPQHVTLAAVLPTYVESERYPNVTAG